MHARFAIEVALANQRFIDLNAGCGQRPAVSRQPPEASDAQDASEKTKSKAAVSSHVDPELTTEAAEEVCKPCFFEGEAIVDDPPKREATEREQKNLDKTIRVIRRFDSQKAAFAKLDKDHNCQLDRTEVSTLLSYAKVNGFVRAIASGRLITRYDLSHDDLCPMARIPLRS